MSTAKESRTETLSRTIYSSMLRVSWTQTGSPLLKSVTSAVPSNWATITGASRGVAVNQGVDYPKEVSPTSPHDTTDRLSSSTAILTMESRLICGQLGVSSLSSSPKVAYLTWDTRNTWPLNKKSSKWNLHHQNKCQARASLCSKEGVTYTSSCRSWLRWVAPLPSRWRASTRSIMRPSRILLALLTSSKRCFKMTRLLRQ